MDEYATGFKRGVFDALCKNGFFLHRLRFNTDYANGYRAGYYKTINQRG